MELYFPALLSRQKAIALTKYGRKKLESLARKGLVRTFTTNGGHKRYFRDDLLKFIYEQV